MPSVRDATAKPTLHRLRVNARLLAEGRSVQVRLHHRGAQPSLPWLSLRIEVSDSTRKTSQVVPAMRFRRPTDHGWIRGHEEPHIDSTTEASLMTDLLLAMLLIGVRLLSLLGDLGLRDLERSSALAEAALRRALEDP